MTTPPLLYFGDNLHILREHIADETVDLIYLDPPFNSKRDYNLLFKTPKGQQADASITAFEDTWHWGEQAEREYGELLRQPNTDVAELMSSLRRFLKESDVMAYLVMMANRLLELHRVLKETGSLYLHCDPTASHYLKIILDTVFGNLFFQNEIVWKRTSAKGLTTKRLPSNHDIIFHYSKTEQFTWNSHAVFKAYDEDNLDEKTANKYTHRDPDGRLYRLDSLINPNPNRPNLTYEFLGITRVWRWTRERMQKAYEAGLVVQTKPGTVPQGKRYLDEQRGKPISDVWADISPLNSQATERLGYPTQKPLALLERIIQASSNPEDLVLDPFCGCGTAVHAAQKLGRNWIGIDITHLSIHLIERRMHEAFPDLKFGIHGEPEDLASARDLAERDKYEFQFWACSLVGAQPYKGGQKGADSGIDGILYFQDDKKEAKKIIVSVKGGEHVTRTQIADLKNTVEREGAEMGFFITLAEPTDPMVKEAVSAGFYQSQIMGDFPKIQILTIEQLLGGAEPRYPDLTMGQASFKKAKTEKKKADQPGLFT